VSRIVAIGEEERLRALRLAGVAVRPAADAGAVREAWHAFAPDAGLVILTQAAHSAVAAELPDREGPLWVVMPG
jgi:vacuolar-type H+-ATPase subunit F/Vma7